MDKDHILAIDCGTTLIKTALVGRDGAVTGLRSEEVRTILPGEGRAEQAPEDIWNAGYCSMQKTLSASGISPRKIAAIGIANQRETVIVWNKRTGKPYRNAVLWYDRRAEELCSEMRGKIGEEGVRRTGIYSIPNTSAMLLSWLLRHCPEIRESADRGDALFGTVNTWLLWKLTGGRSHFTDISNMSVTQLQNAKKLDYDDEMLQLLKIPKNILPEIKGTGDLFGYTEESLFAGAKIPVTGMLGDQMAASLGQGCLKKGEVKSTFGTGCFSVMNAGETYYPPSNGLYSPVLWGSKKNVIYGQESFFEINRDRKNREVIEDAAYKNAEIIRSMEKSTNQKITLLRIDGGMSANDHLCQFQADILGITVERPEIFEATVLGAAYQAGVGCGFWQSYEETGKLLKVCRTFEPRISEEEREKLYAGILNEKTEPSKNGSGANMAENIDKRMAEGIKLARIGFYSYLFDGTILAADKETFDFFELQGIHKDHETLSGKKIESLFEYIGPKGRLRDELREKKSVSRLEYGIKTLKGNEKWGIHNSYLFIDEKSGKEAVQVCFYDITDRKKHEEEKIHLERKIQHSEKLRAIGQLAGGVAHDFNNQLTGIIGFAELLRYELQDDIRLSRYAENIITAARHSAEITGQLLSFARKGSHKTERTDIHRVINEVISILGHSIDKKIRIVHVLNAQSHIVEADPSQIHNALLNLAINSRDAMHEGGFITFRTDNVEVEKHICEVCSEEIASGNYIEVSISDTGTGMSDEVKNRLFEPFFTTKELGKGTGMGLAAVFGTVKEHKGSIKVTSRQGDGTTFRIYLPTSSGSTLLQSQNVPDIKIMKNDLRVLIVDDEMIICRLGKEMLSRSGCKVTCCSNGREALDIFGSKKNDFDLVILDMIMPEMNGKETFYELKKVDPSVKILLSSGYSKNGEVEELLKHGANGFLQKPFSIEELNRRITEIFENLS
jgi:glycerol kinase/signal transduction histidine kinase/CheY-like chemotaxis protein